MISGRDGYVYIMGGDGGPLKVGHSTNIHLRLRTLRWNLKRDLQVLFFLPVASGDLYGVERLTHFLLREHCVGSELFDVSFDTAKDAIMDARYAYLLGRRAPKSSEIPGRELGRLSFLLPSDLIWRIQQWQKRQASLPNRSAAIRELVTRALDRLEAQDRGSL